MKRLVAILLLGALCACRHSAPREQQDFDGGREYRFINNYRAAYYLELAERLQRLDEPARRRALEDLAKHPERGSEVFPLCRLLFKPKPGGGFRRPLLGAACFFGGKDYSDWPLEPITLYRGLPILIVWGYVLGGVPEPPEDYVEYCLTACEWKPEILPIPPRDEREAIVAEFYRTKVTYKPTSEKEFLRQAE